MSKVINTLTAIFGALSIALLAKRGFDIGLAAPFEQGLEYYDKGVHQLLGWAEPYLNEILRRTGWSLHLHPHWKHVLVLMWLYFGVVARVIWPKFKTPRERALLLVLTTWGIIIAAAASIAAGTIELSSGVNNAIMSTFPFAGFVLYQVAWAAFLATLGRQETWWNRYRAAVRLYVGPGVVAVIAAALTLAVFAQRTPILAGLRNPGLALLFGLTVALALYWLWTGVVGAVHFHKPPDVTWWRAFREMKWRQSWVVSANARIGLGMLKCIGGAAVFVLLGAGLE